MPNENNNMLAMLSITKPEAKKTRASVACNTCRDSKLKCLNRNSNARCQRCVLLDLPCSYTLKKSQLKKKTLSKSFNRFPASPPRAVPLNHLVSLPLSVSPQAVRSSSKPTVILPDKDLLLEVAEIYFENQYKGIFPVLHKPSLISFLRSSEFNPSTYLRDYYDKFFEPNYRTSLKYPDPVMLLAVLALCARLHPVMPKIYGEFSEENSPELFVPNFKNRDSPLEYDNCKDISYATNASCYFGWHARNILKEVFDSPTIQRVQALSILSSHEWGEGNVSRSYLYVGVAARMGLVLGLGHEEDLIDKDDISKLDESSKFVYIESKRRTIWAVYMMDRCNGSGRRRSACISLNNIEVRLPCQEKDFIFGNFRQKSLTFKEADNLIYHNPLKVDIDSLNKTSCFGFLIVLFDTWTKIAKWVGETGRKLENLPPWNENSNYYILTKKLDDFLESLPHNLRFNKFNLEAHLADGSSADFAYFHGLAFLCRVFLNREYFFCSPEGFPAGWWQKQTRILLETLDSLSYITRFLRPINKMVIAPFTGFQVFSTAATCLYFNAYPAKMLIKYYITDNPDLTSKSPEIQLEHLQRKYRNLALEQMEELKFWKKYWGLGKVWCETANKLKVIFAKLTEAKSLEDDDLRHSMHDYGSSRVREDYKPEFIENRRRDMRILDLIETDDAPKEDLKAEIKLKLAKSDSATPARTPIDAHTDALSSLNSPSLDFINNFDFANFFPSWNSD